MNENEKPDSHEPSLELPRLTRDQWGWLAVGAGAVGIIGALLHRNRAAVEWLLPLGLLGGGAAVLLQERAKGIDSAEERIVAELESLDPLARAQVMKRVASAEIKGLRRQEGSESQD